MFCVWFICANTFINVFCVPFICASTFLGSTGCSLIGAHQKALILILATRYLADTFCATVQQLAIYERLALNWSRSCFFIKGFNSITMALPELPSEIRLKSRVPRLSDDSPCGAA